MNIYALGSCRVENAMGGLLYTKTRKYPLRGYILGVLTHTTAWDGHYMKVRYAHFLSSVYVPALSYVAVKE